MKAMVFSTLIVPSKKALTNLTSMRHPFLTILSRYIFSMIFWIFPFSVSAVNGLTI